MTLFSLIILRITLRFTRPFFRVFWKPNGFSLWNFAPWNAKILVFRLVSSTTSPVSGLVYGYVNGLISVSRINGKSAGTPRTANFIWGASIIVNIFFKNLAVATLIPLFFLKVFCPWKNLIKRPGAKKKCWRLSQLSCSDTTNFTNLKLIKRVNSKTFLAAHAASGYNSISPYATTVK